MVPIIGAGTNADPRRPLFAPGPNDQRTQEGVQSFSWEPSDDGKYAIVEFVARDRKALAAIETDSRVLKSFAKGKARRDDIERELRQYRNDFAFDVNERGRK